MELRRFTYYVGRCYTTGYMNGEFYFEFEYENQTLTLSKAYIYTNMDERSTSDSHQQAVELVHKLLRGEI